MIISSITAGRYLQIENSGTSDPYIGSSHAPMTGMIRYWNNKFEVYDGSVWMQLGQTFPTIKLHEDAVKAIEWSIKQIEAETKIKELCKNHPAVEIAYQNLQKASDQLKATIILSEDESLETNS